MSALIHVKSLASEVEEVLSVLGGVRLSYWGYVYLFITLLRDGREKALKLAHEIRVNAPGDRPSWYRHLSHPSPVYRDSTCGFVITSKLIPEDKVKEIPVDVYPGTLFMVYSDDELIALIKERADEVFSFLSIVKYIVGLLVLSYVLAFLASFFSPILNALASLGLNVPSGFKFSIDPVENVKGILAYVVAVVNTYIMPHAHILRLASLGLAACSAVAAMLTYMSCRGQLYYVTDRRIVIRRKFGTVQVTTLPLDGLVEVTAFQGFFGRLLGYGDVVLSMISGGGVAQSLGPQPAQPVGSFYEVKRKLEGVRDVWELKDAIIALRDKYVEARYLERIEGELKRIRRAVEEEEPPQVREDRKHVA